MQEGYIEQIGTPRQVYEEPANLNVATFIGEVNVFDGIIVKQEGERKWSVDVLGKTRTVNSPRQFKDQEPVYVIVRPEDVRVWGQPEVDNAADMFAGTVEEVIYKGTTVDLMVRLTINNKLIAATEFFNEDDDRLEYKMGEPVWVTWAPGWEVILPYEA
jgi:spermidine/putrescine transport system ATP-binding protein